MTTQNKKTKDKKSPYRFPYQRTLTNQEVINTITSNPAIYGDLNDTNSIAYKILKSLEVDDS